MYQGFLVAHHLPSLYHREFLTARFTYSSGYTANQTEGPLPTALEICILGVLSETCECDSSVPFKSRIYVTDTSFKCIQSQFVFTCRRSGLGFNFQFYKCLVCWDQMFLLWIRILATQTAWPWPPNPIFYIGWHCPGQKSDSSDWMVMHFCYYTMQFVSLALHLAQRDFNSWLQIEFLETKSQ